MRLVFTTNGWEDYTYWLQADRHVLKRINRLVDGDDLVILQARYHYS